MNVITESNFENVEFQTELDEATNTKKLYIHGITAQSNVKNRNNRIYPEPILDESVNRYIQEKFNMRRAVGELKHPETQSQVIDEERISHRFVEIKKDGNNWITKSLVLETPCGKIAKNLLEGGVQLGISTRCLGSVKSSNGVNIVQSGLRMISMGDLVLDPSAPDAVVNAIEESEEWIYENGILIEKDLSQDIDTYQKLIKETTKQERAKVFEQIVLDYFNKIKVKCV